MGQIGAKCSSAISIKPFGSICCHKLDGCYFYSIPDKIISRFSSWIACVSTSVSNK
jgi:hypothetical protein